MHWENRHTFRRVRVSFFCLQIMNGDFVLQSLHLCRLFRLLWIISSIEYSYLENVDKPVSHLDVHLVQAVGVHRLTLAISSWVQPDIGVVVGSRNVLTNGRENGLDARGDRGWNIGISNFPWMRDGSLPMRPPIKKQKSWHISRKPTITNSLRPLKFSMTVPAIFEVDLWTS